MKKNKIHTLTALTLLIAGLMGTACTNTDELDSNTGNNARTPISIGTLGIGSNTDSPTATAAPRIAVDPTTGTGNTWSNGDAIQVTATPKTGGGQPVTTTFVFADGAWAQKPGNGDTFLYYENIASITDIETWGGKTKWVSTNYQDQSSKENYLLNDYIVADGPIAMPKGVISATLEHQRIDVVLNVKDGDTGNNALPGATFTLADKGGTTKIKTWNAGKTDGTTTFRALLAPEDVPGYSNDSPIAADTPYTLGTLTYGSKSLTVTYKLKEATTIAPGQRLTINVTFFDYQKIAGTATVGDWEEVVQDDDIITGTENIVVGDGTKELSKELFTKDNPKWTVTGGGDDTNDATVLGNVRTALNKITGTGVIDLILPDVKTLPKRGQNVGAFDSYQQLRSFSAPAATSIGDYAFYACTALTTIDLPAATSIGYAAFYTCSALTTINLPAATSIGEYAFAYCTALTTLKLTATATITVDTSIFESCNTANLTITVSSAQVGEGKSFLVNQGRTELTFQNATGGGSPFTISVKNIIIID